ncbi:MAG: 23S rRNA (guanosine(2251)-2'-O)-methyltransferase RlmB [Candidatus Paracaedibacteraceae bacterium]|nr:23S rRNA (guanosine(2251)-2'-O)-methyltransferase RlmB [Candidatus Paracaedibacteraceae bacterium]
MERRTHSSKVFLYGVHAVSAALKNPKRQHEKLYVTADNEPEYKAYSNFTKIVSKKEIEKLLPDGAVHQGVALLTSLLPDLYLEGLPLDKEVCLLLAFDQVTDPHNVGAILRSAACFNVDGVLHTDRNCPPETGVLAKSACGALDYISFAKVVNLARALDDLKERGFWVVGLSEHGTETLDQVDLPKKIVLVVGAEGSGMRRLVMEKCDFLVQLPTNPAFPTLNASNAAAVALYELRQKLGTE